MDKIKVEVDSRYQDDEYINQNKRLFGSHRKADFEKWLENYQKTKEQDYDSPPKFAWAAPQKKDLLGMHTVMYDCRDHICDWLNYPNQKEKERGELLSVPHVNPVPNDATRLLIAFSSNKNADAFIENFEFIHQKEEEFFPDAAPSKLFEVEAVSTFRRLLYVEGDPIFSKSSVTNSFYTLMLRFTPYLQGKRPTLTQLANGAANGRTGDRAYMQSARENVKDLDAYVSALKDIDFSVTHMPYGGVTDEQYCHSVGGFQWMAEYLTRATTDPRFVNVYGNQIAERVIGRAPTKYRGNATVSPNTQLAKRAYLYGEADAYGF